MSIKNIHIAFLGNGLFDSRIVNLYNSLKDEGCNVRVTCFSWENESYENKNPDIKIYRISKKSSIKFYLSFIYFLIRDLLKSNSELFIAEDIYTLPVTYFIAKYKRAKIYYNSREIYAFLAGLRNKRFVQRVISLIEKAFIKKVDLVLTTGEMDSDFLEGTYGLNNTLVIRNLPKRVKPFEIKNIRKIYKIDKKYKILLYQGVLLEGRGIEIILNLLDKIEDAFFLIIGDGPFRRKFEEVAKKSNVVDRVAFTGKIPHEELINFTVECDLGLSIIENISLSYYYALPNKLFEYINAGLPVISSNLPQMKKIVENYDVGITIDPKNKEEIISKINILIKENDLIKHYKMNCFKAAEELNWIAEFNKIKNRLLNE